MTELLVLVSDCDPDIIYVTETHFSSDYRDSEVSIPNYSMFRTDRNAIANGGGLIIYAKSWLLAIRLDRSSWTIVSGSHSRRKKEQYILYVYTALLLYQMHRTICYLGN